MVLGGCMPHLELTAGVSGAGHAHNLHDVDPNEVAGCQLLKPGPVPSPLHFAHFC